MAHRASLDDLEKRRSFCPDGIRTTIPGLVMLASYETDHATLADRVLWYGYEMEGKNCR